MTDNEITADVTANEAEAPERAQAQGVSDSGVEVEEVKEALRDVVDPELGINVVDLGLIYDLGWDDENDALVIHMTLTSAGCPLTDVLEEQTAQALDEVDAAAVGRAVRQGARRARESVVRPQEGTILSVADATAERAEQVCRDGGSLGELTRAAVDAARAALARTPDQLQVLADAGVVDAGGAGYLLFVEALDQVVHEEGAPTSYAVDEFTLNPTLERRPGWTRPVDGAAVTAPHDGPAHEVMYLLHDVDEGGVARLRQRLDEIGDSVVVSTAEDVCHVHVHTDDIGAALEAGIEVADIAVRRPTLDDAFLSLTGHSVAESEDEADAAIEGTEHLVHRDAAGPRGGRRALPRQRRLREGAPRVHGAELGGRADRGPGVGVLEGP